MCETWRTYVRYLALLNFIATLIVAAAFSLGWTRLVIALREDLAINSRTQMLAGLCGGGVHLLLTLSRMQTHPGLDFSLVNAISLISAVTVLAVALSSQRFAIQSLQLILMPIAFAALLGAQLLESSSEPLILTTGMATHILLSMVAYGIFTIAALLAMLLGYSENRLRHHRLTALVKHSPPIEAIESLLFELVTLGSVLLALAVVSGLFFVEDLLAQHLIHKTVLSLLALVIYSFIAAGHWMKGWRGRSAVRWIAGAYVSLSLAYLGSKLVLEWLLQG